MRCKIMLQPFIKLIVIGYNCKICDQQQNKIGFLKKYLISVISQFCYLKAYTGGLAKSF